jgi:serine/threonine protein kinase/tetratricopeptide (TPR) repeat protein
MTMTSLSDRDDDRPACDGELDEFVQAFEETYLERGAADPAAFLPPVGHPLRAAVLHELVRVDLEFGWERGRPGRLDEYRRAFPELDDDPDGLREIAFEEFRLRRRAGEDPSPEEYRERYGLTIDPRTGRSRRPEPGPGGGRGGALRSWSLTVTGQGRGPALPAVGEEFLGFRLVGELGRGAFGRVFLARQGELADRPVVLKVTAERHDESQTLAQLRHDHIVPVYSRHRAGALGAVCMPYLGSVTLRDVLRDLKAQGSLPDSGLGLLSSLAKSSERKGPALPVDDPSSSGTADVPGPAAPRAVVGGAAPAARRDGRPAPRVGGDGHSAGPGPGFGANPATADPRAWLGGLSYVEAVVWLGSRLADGLAHAHDRGIVHRDLKPANVLLTDDGRPMLLDFNLAEDLKRQPDPDGGGVGGTLPYMAPEHLAAFLDGGKARPEAPARRVDERSDLYALGVILFELLTGRPPFPVHDAVHPAAVRAMIADRQGPPPSLRAYNPGVSPAVDSVVRRLLEPDPARRYGSARELVEDLERHLAHRPLRHAPDPSPRERAAKWARRHPRLCLAAALAAASALALAAGTAFRVARLEASGALERFRDGAMHARDFLEDLRDDPSRRVEGLDRARRALAEVGAADDSSWLARVRLWALPDPDRRALRDVAGELYALMAFAEVHRIGAPDDPAAGRRALDAAACDCALAEASFGPGRTPRGVWEQKAELARLRGDDAEAQRCLARSAAVPPGGARDLALSAVIARHRGRVDEAGVLFERAARLNPRAYRAWFGLGLCHLDMGHDDRAEADLSTCLGIASEQPDAWMFRGIAALKLGKLDRAEADFSEVIRLAARDPSGYFNRGVARLRAGRPKEAVEDFDRAESLGGGAKTRLYFTRARARAATGDLKGAESDRQEGLLRLPRDEMSWVERGNARAARGDFGGALGDYDQALRLSPRSYPAVMGKAAVLSEHLGKTREAIEVLDGLLDICPGSDAVRASRAVLRARLGRRDEALADARLVLAHGPDPPPLLYQIAGVYALTSRQVADDRREALRLLTRALRRGDGLDVVDADPDLDPIRDDPEFRRVVADARDAPRADHLP